MQSEIKGLTLEEVTQRKSEKKVNVHKNVKGKSHLKIIFESFVNPFNLVLYGVALCFLFFQIFYPDGTSYIPVTKYGFLLVVLINAFISIVSQEISKKTLEKMRLISEPTAVVIRDGKEVTIKNEEIVLDDIVFLKAGNEAKCDLKVIEGTLFVNESNLTGESRLVKKEVGDEVFSGSLISEGNAYLKAIRVGENSFSSKLENKISDIKKSESILLKDIKSLIYILLIFLIPCALAVCLKTFYIGENGNHWVFTPNVITKTATVIVGMITIGMLFLTSLTLSKSIILLSKQNVMIQELYAVEKLSRVNELCLDKTGTLTNGNFEFVKIEKFTEFDENKILSKVLRGFREKNALNRCLEVQYGTTKSDEIKEVIEFNSTNKFSGVIFNNGDKILIGAPEIIFKDEEKIKFTKQYTKDGFRCVGLTKNDEELCFFVLKDSLRDNINKSLSYFDELGINVRIISGDSIDTVKNISKQAGVKNYEKAISMENVSLDEIPQLVDEYYVFARTTPDQKEAIINALQEKGRKVGYVGDGVNDVTSLRRSNCAIALRSGVDSTKAVADVILLDDDFNHMPQVFEEGKRVVANISRSLHLFLTKSFFIGTFALLSLFFAGGMVFEIEAIYIYEFISISLCGLLLSLQHNKPVDIDKNFKKKILVKTALNGTLMSLFACVPLILSHFVDIKEPEFVAAIIVTLSGTAVMIMICKPFTKYTTFVALLGSILTILLSLALPDVFFRANYLKGAGSISGQMTLIKNDFFNFESFGSMSQTEIIVLIVTFVLVGIVFFLVDALSNKFIERVFKKKA